MFKIPKHVAVFLVVAAMIVTPYFVFIRGVYARAEIVYSLYHINLAPSAAITYSGCIDVRSVPLNFLRPQPSTPWTFISLSQGDSCLHWPCSCALRMLQWRTTKCHLHVGH